MTKTVRKSLMLAWLAVLSGLTGSCATNPATGGQDLVLMSEDQELSLGRQLHGEILKEYEVYDDKRLQDYVQRIGDKIARNSHRKDLIYRFTVLDSPEVNAFALPGGYIYITRGILAYLNSEAELAAVLGHEIGHVTARHAVRRHSAGTMTGLAAAILGAASGIPGAGDIGNLLGTALVRGYGREHELEADSLGAEYIANTNYDPKAMLDVIGMLKNQESFEKELARTEDREPRTYHGLFSTHPDNDKRLKSIINARRKPGQATYIGKNEYLNMIDGLTYAENTRQGILRGQRFYHAELDFTVDFPAGWRVKNKPDRLVATAPGNDGLLIITVQDRNKRIGPEEFLRQRLGLDDLQHTETFTHRDMQGFTATTEAKTGYGARRTRFIVIYHKDKAFVVAGAARDANAPFRYDDAILQTGKSFRPLDKDEIKLSQSRKLKVIQWRGQSYSELAEQSSLNHLAEQHIRLLNNHYPQGKPAPGDLIKIIE